MNRYVLSIGALAASWRVALAQEPAEPAPAAEPASAPTSLEPAPAQPPPAPPAIAPAPAALVAEPAARAVVERFPAWRTSRLVLDLELYTQARLVRRSGDDLSELRLDRGELGARVGIHRNAAAELRLEAIRSAPDGGALGIDGNSTVVRVKRAQLVALQAFGAVRIDGAIGIAADPWIATLERDYTVKPLSRTGSERMLDWPTSDLAAVVSASVGPVRATAGMGNGEGLRFPERNTGKTLTGVVEIVPVATESLRVSAALLGRDGSVGVTSIRDHRLGGALTAVTPRARLSAEVVQAWGIADRGDAKGLLVAAWAEARPVAKAIVAARGASLGYTGGGRQTTLGGGLAVEPWPDTARGMLRLWLAVDRVTTSGAAMPLPGADAGDATLFMLIAAIHAPYEVD
jgi:hypothetical protein